MSSEKDFGPSIYGPRLDFKNRKCRDIPCAILFCLHIAGVIAVVCYIFTVYYDQVVEQIETVSDVNVPDAATSLDWTGVYVAIPVCFVCGLLFGLLWLQIMRLFAEVIIKLLLFINCIAWTVLFIVGCVYVNEALIIIAGLLALFWILYTWCVWSRVAFSTAILSISCEIAGWYSGTIGIAIITVIMDAVWFLLWGSMLWGYLIIAEHDEDNGVLWWVILLMLLSFYWGMEVIHNIGHTTYCGVTAVWFFSRDPEHKLRPSFPALYRALTSSLGSIAFGSILVAVLEVVRTMVAALNNDKCKCVSCCVMCCLNCIQWLIEYFNKYAYAHCAIYGTSFTQSASNTFKLFANEGITALLNDDLTGSVLFCGALIAGIATGAVGYGIGYAFYYDHEDAEVREGVPIGLAVYGGFIGLVLCVCVLTVVKSGIVSLFTCYAEEKGALRHNHPKEYNKLVKSHKMFSNQSLQSIPDEEIAEGTDGEQDNETAPMKTTDNTSLGVKI